MSFLRTGLLLVLVAATAWMCWGCAGGGRGEATSVVADPTARVGPEGQSLYTLRVGDQLDISFLTDESLQYSMPISPAGTISLPTGDEIRAAGLTMGELRSVIEEKMSAYLLDSRASVTIREVARQPVYVLGEVARPGEVDMINGNITVSMAVAEAGGLLSTGKPSSVVVIRTTGEDEATGFEVDMSKVLSGRDLSENIALEPYDIVFVPKSVIGKIDEFVELFFESIAPAQLFYLRGYDIAKRRPLGVYQ
jgi:protein involved in polysaccharide export with SLBB domain